MSHAVVQTIEKLLELDEQKIFRNNLGDASFKNFQPLWDELLMKVDFIKKFNSNVSRETNKQVNNSLTIIINQLAELTNLDNSQFVANQNKYRDNIIAHLEVVKNYWPFYAIAAIEDSGLLTNIDVKKKFSDLTESLKRSTEDALAKIQEESNAIIEEARKNAQTIESKVRKTAQDVSVEKAQEQFGEAATHNLNQIKIWGGITGGLIIAFIIFIVYLLRWVKLPAEYDWTVIYFSIIRLGILGIISTILGFSIKMLRANLHMHQHNLHRKRIANSMAAFAESAMNSDQRDLILSQLVESVSNFGSSGMIGKESDSGISIDSITKTVSTLKGSE